MVGSYLNAIKVLESSAYINGMSSFEYLVGRVCIAENSKKYTTFLKKQPNTLLYQFPGNYPYLDIYSSNQKNSKVIVPQYGCHWKYETVFPLKEYIFRGHSFWIPNKPELYLYNNYGPDWKIELKSKSKFGVSCII